MYVIFQDTQLQIFHSILDQIYHGKDFRPLTPQQVLQQTQNKYYGIPYVQNTVSFVLLYTLLFLALMGQRYLMLLNHAIFKLRPKFCFADYVSGYHLIKSPGCICFILNYDILCHHWSVCQTNLWF